jgi:hypothetical protein
MPRRAGGKAGSRRARQRSAERAARHRPSPPPASTGAPTAVPPVGTPDAREAVSLDPPRRTTPPEPRAGDSHLSAGVRAEYHYVERDLRNIGILTAAMVVLLVVAWFAFRALGIAG